MTAWTRDREPRAIVAHVARCCFCRALLAHGRRRSDRALLAWMRMIYERHQAGAKNPWAWWEVEPPAGPRA